MMKLRIFPALFVFLMMSSVALQAFGVVTTQEDVSSAATSDSGNSDTAATETSASSSNSKFNFIKPEFGRVQQQTSSSNGSLVNSGSSDAGLTTSLAPVVMQNSGFQLGKLTTSSNTAAATNAYGDSVSGEASPDSSTTTTSGTSYSLSKKDFKFGQVTTNS